jgi:hypothetical protein
MGATLTAQWFAGGGGGISTLSADGQTRIDGASTGISLYKPENGLSAHGFVGRHVREYFSVQGSYTWNRNALSLTGSTVANGVEATYQQDYKSQSHGVAAEAMAYFRPRGSRIRPYVAGGLGLMHMGATGGAVTVSKGNVRLPPGEFSATKAMWRTSVGVDFQLGRGYSFRYNFWESLSGNPISKQLTPPGERNLANFQSIFSVVRTF